MILIFFAGWDLFHIGFAAFVSANQLNVSGVGKARKNGVDFAHFDPSMRRCSPRMQTGFHWEEVLSVYMQSNRQHTSPAIVHIVIAETHHTSEEAAMPFSITPAMFEICQTA
ncbi:hypothetical protein [Massilia glaciei]|uniref:Uncharacterized protein n=1 Tax=Massilia glaciei TaxID=1524097 RepID=A0A2U2HN02_9BURK|nr:hypothetical protein [Massilia glaciei]PWF48806.1 hypothetical protein C7C56_010045 [Massilia glaciei]